MSSPAQVVYNIHYHGPFNNFGQHSAGQGTINNISSPQTTDSLPSSSDQSAELKSFPETGIRCPREVQSDHQPAECESSPSTTICSACNVRFNDQPAPIHPAHGIQSEDQPAELKSPPDSARNALSEAQRAAIKNSPEETNLPPRADKSIANTTNAGRTIPRNIVVFGQARSGRSSVINLLTGSSVANVPGGPANCTISHGDNNYTFWDTPGLDEAKNGTSVSLGGDVQNLLNLVRYHGVSLLIYCIRGSLADINRLNYDFFWKILCVEKVPVVLVVTGLEGRDKWWQENIETIMKMKMVFAGHVCIASWNGTRGMYEESAEKVWKLVREQCTSKPWHMTSRWSAQAQKIIAEYEKHFKARTMRKLLRELARNLSLSNSQPT